ncbi:hypothetical protein [Bifidobacterium pseudocatenulatum]|uniref:Uncharacterized protein n=1 Tax=Bifidobacterium pseudocatenulatum TaxID=28026 RepID=A0ABD4W9U5_BIFPS|nr:hypothetical protein [Bifidobacterium pseudocatenulatum]MDB6492417.1 hypothetical protein [Bifidobacterium pseudocatenulatum]MDB6493612.1 hypothetical protein [Bifidobacterium pseudocatenulatum]MDB6504761.1 hypothetical protein [Bifidobacterium pseudocatenulatum]
MKDYRKYEPILTESLPARFAGIFHLLELTFTPANDRTIVTTIDGRNLQLVCQGGTEEDHRKKRARRRGGLPESHMGTPRRPFALLSVTGQAMASRPRHGRP